MKTDDLIKLLATGVEAVEPHAAERRYVKAIGLGLTVAAVLMVVLLRVRADLALAILLPMFWVKLGFAASLLATAAFAALRMSRPGAQVGSVPLVIGLPVLLMWMMAAYVLLTADAGQRAALLLGESWSSCPFLIALLSVPVFIAVIRAMQGLAPTQTRRAGFVAGLLSGATAALVYCLHCPESSAPFIGLWYTLGMLIPAIAGALLGPRLLRW